MAFPDTPKLGLQKSDTGEPYPLAKYNSNLDKIDSAMGKLGVQLPFDVAENRVISNWADFNSAWEAGPLADQTNKLIRRGPWCFIEVFAKRKGADLNNSTTGDLGNQLVLTLKSQYRPAEHTPLYTMNQGRLVMAYLDVDGGIRLAAITGDATANFNTGHAFNVAGWYILEEVD